MNRPSLLLPVVLSALLLAGCGTTVVNPVSGQAERTVLSEEAEVAEGRKAHAEVLQQFGTYPDARLQAYVNEVGQRLARQSHRAKLQWTFTVLDSPEINAFALPGGYVYITRGIMAYMDSEADLAGVLGHEIGHVTARHGAQRATRAQSAGIGVLAATVLGAVLEAGGVRGAGSAIGQVSQGAAASYVASYSREQELQADGLGAEYLARSRYNPKSMVDVIRLLKDQERFAADAARAEGKPSRETPNWLASHPSSDQRLAEIQKTATKYSGTYGDDGQDRYLRAVDGMSFGESRSQGVTRGRNFYHEELGIAATAPAGWKIQNTPSAVLFVHPAADAALILRTAPPQAGTTHEEILRALKVEQPRASRTQVNGLPATRFAGLRRTEQGQAVPVAGTLITGPGDRNYLLVHAGQDAAAIERVRPQLEEATASLRPLTSADRAAARPWAVRTVPYPRGGFAQLAQQSPLEARAEAHLRLLNGYYEGGEPKLGSLVKTIVAP